MFRLADSTAPQGRSSLGERLLAKRRLLLLVVHAVLIAIAFWLALLLRFDFAPPMSYIEGFPRVVAIVICVKLLVFMAFGDLHGWWRHVSFEDLTSLLRVATLSMLILAFLDHVFLSTMHIPRSMLLIDWGCTMLLFGGSRSVWRIWNEGTQRFFETDDRLNALLVGADQSALALARQINADTSQNYRIVAFLDNNVLHHGSRLGGIPIVGSTANINSLAAKHQAKDVLIIEDRLVGDSVRDMLERCRESELRLKVIPSVNELLSDDHGIKQIRDVNIEDLLRRDPVELDHGSIQAMIGSETVMVTGAGGSIGSEICRQILRCEPRRLLLVERAENSLFQIEQELLKNSHGAEIVPCVADIRDEKRMDALFGKHRPRIVFHAAAHKHVPLMESNLGEAIDNNTCGTRLMTNLAHAHDVERFVHISTDKAVRPSSIMGVSKLLAERYVHAFSQEWNTKFVVVRFGNVLASAGSVVPIFQEQIRRGGPVTVTHPDMQRYFMTIPEASQLVLKAASECAGSEIFVLEMGEPVRILDLARDVIRLSGFSENEVKIEFTGARPGEKIIEEVLYSDEETLPTRQQKLRVARPLFHSLSSIADAIDELATLVHADEQTMRKRLTALVPEYAPHTISNANGNGSPDLYTHQSIESTVIQSAK